MSAQDPCEHDPAKPFVVSDHKLAILNRYATEAEAVAWAREYCQRWNAIVHVAQLVRSFEPQATVTVIEREFIRGPPVP